MCRHEFEVKEPGLRECWRAILVVAIIGVLATGAALYPVFQQHAQAEKQRVGLIKKQQIESVEQTKIKAANAPKITKKRKGKMVKIALGQTKQADAVSSSGGHTTGCVSYPGSVTSHWTAFQGVTVLASELSPGAWVFDNGTVTVPVGPSLIGVCQVVETLDYADHQCPDSDETSGSKFQQVWEFEVVCVDGEIRIHPVS